MSKIYKIIYLNSETGEHGLLPDLGIINAGGVIGPTFTVGGKGLLFDDGTSTSTGSGSVNLTLQGAYDGGNGQINLAAGKNFLIRSLNTDIFTVDAATGKVTITGDLEVQGSSTVIEGTISNLDQVQINPPNPTSTALIIEPQFGVTMAANLVTVRALHGGQAVFTIDSTGNTYLRTLTTDLINGIDITVLNTTVQTTVADLASLQVVVTGLSTALSTVSNTVDALSDAVAGLSTQVTALGGAIYDLTVQVDEIDDTVEYLVTTTNTLTTNLAATTYDLSVVQAELADHLAPTGIKHAAEQISVAGPFQNVSGSNVEQALASIDTQLSSIGSTIKTWAHVQTVAAPTWNIVHNHNSVNATLTVYDDTGRQVLPAEVRVLDGNNITVSFGENVAGRVVILLF